MLSNFQGWQKNHNQYNAFLKNCLNTLKTRHSDPQKNWKIKFPDFPRIFSKSQHFPGSEQNLAVIWEMKKVICVLLLYDLEIEDMHSIKLSIKAANTAYSNNAKN